MNDSSEVIAWIGIGLSKADRILFRNQVFLWVSIMAVSMLALAAWLTVIVSRKITRPMTDLVRAAEAVKQGQWVSPVGGEDESEIGYLVGRFNDMALSVQVTKKTLQAKLDELALAHEALTQTQDQLVQSAKMSSLGQLVAGVAHELNNPIAFIYSNMSQMRSYLKNIEKLDKTIKELDPHLDIQARGRMHQALSDIEWDYLRQDMNDIVQSCLEGSIRVKDIVLGLRNFSRLDKGEVTEADINNALIDSVKLLSGQIKNRVEVHWDLCQNAVIRCNVSQINQVLMNLVANAVQSIEGRGHVWIQTSSMDSQEDLLISVRDDGKGIAPENIQKIFDPFFTTKKVGEGTGLGLSIVYGIIERHHGSIRVKSQLAPASDHGTEFIVSLPRSFVDFLKAS